MPIQHRNIPDAERHEPKDISTSTVDTVYVSNGSASGTWKELPFIITAKLDDVSAPSFVLIPLPVNVLVQSIRFVLGGAITLANSIITVTRAGVDAMGSAVIPFSGSAEGVTVDLIPSGNNSFNTTTQKYVKIVTDGGSTTTAPLFISLKCKVI